MGIRLELQPQQTLAFTCPGTEILYGGAAGGGKGGVLTTPANLLKAGMDYADKKQRKVFQETIAGQVLTPFGFKLLDDVKIGDQVCNPDGGVSRIVAIKDNGVMPCFRVTFIDGESVIVDEDHLWPIWQAGKRRFRKQPPCGLVGDAQESAAQWNAVLMATCRSITTRKLAELMDVEAQRERPNWPITPICRPCNFTLGPGRMDAPPPYTLGVLLGDGCLTQDTTPTWQKPDLELAEFVREELAAQGIQDVVHAIDAETGRHSIVGCRIREMLRSAKISGLRSEEKFVPTCFKFAPQATRLALLQGLLDTDAHADSRGHVEFSSASRQLAEDVRHLAASLGYCAGMSLKPEPVYAVAGEKRIGQPSWRVYIKGGRTDLLFRLPRKRDATLRYNNGVSEPGRRIVSVEPVAAMETRCIQVDHPNSLYITNGFVVTHNSHLMRVDAIHWCLSVPGLQAYIFRRNYPDLRLNHMEGPTSFPELLAPLINKRRAAVVGEEIRFSNGSKIHLCHLQYTKSLLKYQGAEIHWLGLDELTHFDENHYRYLRARCRLGSLRMPPGIRGRLPRIVCGTNPGGIGHHWVKRTFIRLGPMRPVKMPPREGGMVRIFIPAKLRDNPALLKNDPDYEDRLEALGDPVLVRAMREGDWDVVAGAMFGDVWRKPRHVCEPFPIPSDWEIWRGADDGYAAPAACYWLTRDPTRKTYYVIDEVYKARMLPEDYAERVLKKDRGLERIASGEIYLNPERLDGLMDDGAFADTGQGEITRGDQIVKLGAKFRPVEKWAGSRIARVQNMHRLLATNPKDPDGKPGIIFFDRCKKAIETIPTLPRAEKRIEDVDTDAEDHAFDAVTYGLQWRKQTVRRMRVRGI